MLWVIIPSQHKLQKYVLKIELYKWKTITNLLYYMSWFQIGQKYDYETIKIIHKIIKLWRIILTGIHLCINTYSPPYILTPVHTHCDYFFFLLLYIASHRDNPQLQPPYREAFSTCYSAKSVPGIVCKSPLQLWSFLDFWNTFPFSLGMSEKSQQKSQDGPILCFP